jgi:hypothetical protein
MESPNEKNKKEQQALMAHWRVKVQKPNPCTPITQVEEVKEITEDRRGSAPSSMQTRFKVDRRKSISTDQHDKLRYSPYIQRRNSFHALQNRESTAKTVKISSDDVIRQRVQSCPQIFFSPSMYNNSSLFKEIIQQQQFKLERRMGLNEMGIEQRKQIMISSQISPTPTDPEINTLISKFFVFSENNE